MHFRTTHAFGVDVSTILITGINGSFPNYNLFQQYLGINHLQVSTSLRFSEL